MTSKSFTARVVISAKSKRLARSICEALEPDLSALPNGDNVTISLKGSDLVIKIEASDVSSLRASLNSYLLLAGASVRCLTL